MQLTFFVYTWHSFGAHCICNIYSLTVKLFVSCVLLVSPTAYHITITALSYIVSYYKSRYDGFGSYMCLLVL